jgi:aspartate/methionine/tyrosine aminotransferase
LEEWLWQCRGASIDLDHSAAPNPLDQGFDPTIEDEGSLDAIDLEEKLTDTVARAFRVESERVALTNGAQHANFLFLMSVLSPGDTVAVERPGYTPIEDTARALSCNVLTIERACGRAYAVEEARVRSVLQAGAKALAFTNLHNPTAAVMTSEEVKIVLDAGREKDVPVLFDETFREMAYAEPPRPAFELGENGVSTCGLSKLWGLGGLRIGWLIGPERLAKRVSDNRICTTYRLPSISMAMALRAVRRKEWFRERAIALAAENLPVLRRWLEREERVQCKAPDGGFMALMHLPSGIDDLELGELMIDKYRTAICPGRFFGAPGSIRVTFSCDVKRLDEGLTNISRALDQLCS